MKLKEICELCNTTVLHHEDMDKDITNVFSSDLMSDVLTCEIDNALLITGLANIQAIRTAEMADIDSILFVRGKEITPNMLKLAKESHITLLQTKLSMFKTCGLLYEKGLEPVY